MDMASGNALDKLRQGFEHFKKEVYQQQLDTFQQLSQGQSPKVTDLIEECTADLNLTGEAFMVRNIANMVPPYDQTRYCGVGAALEYAVLHLKVANIVVVGHSRCGGIKGLMSIKSDGSTSSDFIEEWVKICAAAMEKVKDEHANLSFAEQCTKCEVEAVNVSLSNLLSYPFVKQALANKSLSLYGGYYNFVDCSLDLWEANQQCA